MRYSILLLAIGPVLSLAASERVYVGLSAGGQRIEAELVEAASAQAPTVLLIGGLHGEDQSSRIVSQELRSAEAAPPRVRVLAIPIANPGSSRLEFPPSGVAYRDHPESHALWRWIALHAPDLALIVGDDDGGLAGALSESMVAGVGRIPAHRVDAKPGILRSLPRAIPSSDAHREMDRRRARSPRQLGEELAAFYGHDFDQVTYINTVALIARIRLGQLADVEKLAAPWTGAKDPIGPQPSGSTLAGHLVFGELAGRTGNPRWTAMVRKAADFGFDAHGAMQESMPFHDEMSDAVFMGAPILAQAGKLTGEGKYFEMAARHLSFMASLDLRPDGLYRHSPLNDAAWGRGNGFPALGLALTLSDFPKDHAGFAGILEAYRRLMAALSRYQDRDGMWHEVIDEPGSYPETSATSMIAFSMLSGIHNGWLDRAAYQARVDRAWQAVLSRVGREGVLMDVCESTGKQRTLQDYLNRAASLDKDARGGAMAMLLATGMAGL